MSNAALDRGFATLQGSAPRPSDRPSAALPSPSLTTSAPSASIGAGTRADASGRLTRGRAWWLRRGPSSAARRALLVFGVPALVALALVAAGAGLVVRERGSGEATRDAGRMARTVGLGLIEPRLTDGVLAGEPDAVAALDTFVRRQVLPLDP